MIKKWIKNDKSTPDVELSSSSSPHHIFFLKMSSGEEKKFSQQSSRHMMVIFFIIFCAQVKCIKRRKSLSWHKSSNDMKASTFSKKADERSMKKCQNNSNSRDERSLKMMPLKLRTLLHRVENCHIACLPFIVIPTINSQCEILCFFCYSENFIPSNTTMAQQTQAESSAVILNSNGIINKTWISSFPCIGRCLRVELNRIETKNQRRIWAKLQKLRNSHIRSWLLVSHSIF